MGFVSDETVSILLGTAGLSVAGLVAAFLSASRSPATAGSSELRRAGLGTVATIACQSAHFAEELLAGFSRKFPPVLGLAPWPTQFFISFNLSWIVIWIFSCWTMTTGRRVALFPVWFLAVASMMNGVAHPLLALRAGGYFPGLLTSPLVSVMGVVLARQLLQATADAVARPTR
jgi:hypothetical protein